MVGIQFQVVGTDAEEPVASFSTLEDSFAGYDEDYNYGTIMEVWNGSGYTTYGWSGTSGTDVDDDPSYDNQWLDFGTAKTDDMLTTSQGVWIKAEKTGDMTLSGEVKSEDVDVDLTAGYNLVAYPYPAAVKIADFGKLDASFAGYDEDYNYATIMEVWNGTGYTTYGWSGTSGTDVDDDSSFDNQWLDFGTAKTDDELGAGAAVWIKAEKAGKLSFESPIQ